MAPAPPPTQVDFARSFYPCTGRLCPGQEDKQSRRSSYKRTRKQAPEKDPLDGWAAVSAGGWRSRLCASALLRKDCLQYGRWFCSTFTGERSRPREAE